MKGAKETFAELRKKKFKTAVISSGPLHLALRCKKELGINFIFSNELVIKNNIIRGGFNWPIGFGKDEKAIILDRLVKRLRISLQQVAYIGENDNDIGVCRKAGLSICFNSRSKELEKVCDFAVSGKDLTEILKYL